VGSSCYRPRRRTAFILSINLKTAASIGIIFPGVDPWSS